MTPRAPNWIGSKWLGSMISRRHDRPQRPALALLCTFALGTIACAGAKEDGPETPDEGAEPAVPDGLDKRDLSKMKTLVVDGTFCDRRGKRADQLDTNHDNRADLITLYDSEGRITCKQADLDFDGRLDAFFHYTDGELRREQYDQDRDGRIDTGRYLKEGQVYLLEQDLNRDGYVDTWRRYDRGRLVRLENDRDFDGRADLFVHYVGGKIDRVGYDVDGNGKVDSWDHDAARRAAAALDSLSAAEDPEAPKEEEAFVEEPTPEGPASGAVDGGKDDDVGKLETRDPVEDERETKTLEDDKTDKGEKEGASESKAPDSGDTGMQKPGAQKPGTQKPAAQRPGTQKPGA
jgi:hypothetical protein